MPSSTERRHRYFADPFSLRAVRILITMTGSWGTGSGTVVEALVAGFTARGHRVCVLYPENTGVGGVADDTVVRAPAAQHEVWTFPIQEGDVRVDHFPLMISDPNPRAPADALTYAGLTRAQRDVFVRRFRDRLQRVVDEFQPDVIECQHIWLMASVVADAGLPFCAMAHHSDQMAYRRDTATAPYALQAAREAWALFALMEGSRREIVDLYSVPPERVVVMGNGYDREVFQPMPVDRAAVLARHGLSVPDDAPIVTFAGKLSRTKGIDVILEANRLLRTSMANPPHLILFGTGTLETALDPQQVAAGTYSLDGCHWLGHQPYTEVRDVHNLARASLMPSRTEGFGLAALEAMGCGCPVIVSRLGGLDAYTVGEVVEPEDAVGLARAIQRLVELDEPAHAALRAEALAVAQTFSWEAIVDKRLALYAEAPPMPPRARPADAAAVVPLRTRILRPGWTDRLATYPEDDLDTTVHLAAWQDDAVVAVGTVYPEAPPLAHRGAIPADAYADGAAFRLRGMASAEHVRGQRYGAAVLDACFRQIRAAGGRYLWCNARLGAVPFYRRMGLHPVGPLFDIPEIGPHYVMWRALDD